MATPLTSMLKTTGLSDLTLRKLGTDEIIGGGDRADKTVVNLFKSSKSRRIVKSSKTSKA